MRSAVSLLICLLALPAAAQTFPVVHKKAFWPDGAGELGFERAAHAGCVGACGELAAGDQRVTAPGYRPVIRWPTEPIRPSFLISRWMSSLGCSRS